MWFRHIKIVKRWNTNCSGFANRFPTIFTLSMILKYVKCRSLSARLFRKLNGLTYSEDGLRVQVPQVGAQLLRILWWDGFDSCAEWISAYARTHYECWWTRYIKRGGFIRPTRNRKVPFPVLYSPMIQDFPWQTNCIWITKKHGLFFGGIPLNGSNGLTPNIVQEHGHYQTPTPN